MAPAIVRAVSGTKRARDRPADIARPRHGREPAGNRQLPEVRLRGRGIRDPAQPRRRLLAAHRANCHGVPRVRSGSEARRAHRDAQGSRLRGEGARQLLRKAPPEVRSDMGPPAARARHLMAPPANGGSSEPIPNNRETPYSRGGTTVTADPAVAR